MAIILFHQLLLHSFLIVHSGCLDILDLANQTDPLLTISEIDPSLIDPNSSASNGLQSKDDKWCDRELCPHKDYGPLSPYVPCDHLPMDFLDCDELFDHQGNETSLKLNNSIGCLKFQAGDEGM